jgi:pimeloyl-ACP methyl ester carboxylesterase
MEQAQAHALDAETLDTLDQRVVPIVLVPGVMGSRVDIAGATCDWDPDDAVEMAGWILSSRRRNVRFISFRSPGTILRSMTDGDTSAVTSIKRDVGNNPELERQAFASLPSGSRVKNRRLFVWQFYEARGWSELSWKFYGPILTELAVRLNRNGESHPVYGCGYDWRQTNEDSARTLLARVNGVLAKHPLAKKVILVTHSMGGLVTRAALLQGLETKVLGVIHCVMPSDGAIVAYRRMLTGAYDDEFGLKQILGVTRIDYALMQSVLRGPTELLPADAYPEPFLRFHAGITNKDLPDVFAEYCRQEPPGLVFSEGDAIPDDELVVTAADVDNLRARFNEARVLTRSIAGVAHPKTHLLVGDDQATDIEFDWTRGSQTVDGSKMESMVIKRNEGDGTVPRASARYAAATRALSREHFPVGHADCFASSAFREAVISRVVKLLNTD